MSVEDPLPHHGPGRPQRASGRDTPTPRCQGRRVVCEAAERPRETLRRADVSRCEQVRAGASRCQQVRAGASARTGGHETSAPRTGKQEAEPGGRFTSEKRDDRTCRPRARGLPDRKTGPGNAPQTPTWAEGEGQAAPRGPARRDAGLAPLSSESRRERRRRAGDGLGEVRAEHRRERRNPADSRSRANPNQDEVKDAPSSTRAHRSQTWAHEGRPPREQRQRRPLAPGEGRRQPECPHKTGRRDRHARLPVGTPREGRNAGRPHAQDHAEPAKPPEAGAHAAARGVRGQPKGQWRGRSRRDSEKRACHAAGGRGWYRPGKSTAPQLPTV